MLDEYEKPRPAPSRTPQPRATSSDGAAVTATAVAASRTWEAWRWPRRYAQSFPRWSSQNIAVWAKKTVARKTPNEVPGLKYVCIPEPLMNLMYWFWNVAPTPNAAKL